MSDNSENNKGNIIGVCICEKDSIFSRSCAVMSHCVDLLQHLSTFPIIYFYADLFFVKAVKANGNQFFLNRP